jgi:hypothetical protein
MDAGSKNNQTIKPQANPYAKSTYNSTKKEATLTQAAQDLITDATLGMTLSSRVYESAIIPAPGKILGPP